MPSDPDGALEPGGDSIAIENLEVIVDQSFSCDPNSTGEELQCARYVVRFNVNNQTEFEVLEVHKSYFAVDGSVLADVYTYCNEDPWRGMVAGETSALTDIVVQYNHAESSGDSFLELRCGGSGIWGSILPLPPAPLSGMATLRLEGLLSNQDPWMMEATVALSPRN